MAGNGKSWQGASRNQAQAGGQKNFAELRAIVRRA
jgi:hypothetical protein